MADQWLRRLELVNNIPRNNLNRRRIYQFDYDNYDEEQFLSRFRLTKDGFRTLLAILRHELSGANERGRPIPADMQLLLTLRFYATFLRQVRRVTGGHFVLTDQIIAGGSMGNA